MLKKILSLGIILSLVSLTFAQDVDLVVEGNLGIGTANPSRTFSINAPGEASCMSFMSGDVEKFAMGYNASQDGFLIYSTKLGPSIGNVLFIDATTGNLWIKGKLTQAGCPDYSNITPLEFIQKSINKTEHITQEEVDALMHLVIEQAAQIEKLTKKTEVLEAKLAVGEKQPKKRQRIKK